MWIFGIIIFLMMMATAFLGYVLPWGQMSFWGATVITNLFSAIPFVGDSIVALLWGNFSVDDQFLNRAFILHWLIAFGIIGVVLFHVIALHITGSNNPSGVEPVDTRDTISFAPYMTQKDLFASVVFLTIFAVFLFWMPNFLGHPDNYIKADPLVTPAHIVPEWYFLPFYAILRAVPDKLAGILLMVGAIAVLFVLPWLDTSKVRSLRFRPVARWFFFIFVVFCFILGWCGAETPDDMVFTVGEKVVDGSVTPVGLNFVWLSRIATIYYFAYFLIILPILGLIEKPLARPDSITKAVLGKEPRGGGLAAAE